MITSAWVLAFIPLLPSLFEFYGTHGLECQTRECKIISNVDNGKVKRQFEFVLHIFWAIHLVTVNLGILLRYWVGENINTFKSICQSYIIITTKSYYITQFVIEISIFLQTHRADMTETLSRNHSFDTIHHLRCNMSVHQSFFTEMKSLNISQITQINKTTTEKKLTRIVIVVVMVFFLTYLPIFIVRTVRKSFQSKFIVDRFIIYTYDRLHF